ncbi:MAG: hypothetical protein CRN43_16125 [Candidatus Nephrothrix sp. EaCA]|nr:MAG: hypothetical protein CRN43_16125 [Candidatus Nephrothrix sp. EaCA]
MEVSESEHENGTYGRLDGDFLDPDQFANGFEEEGAERPVDPEEERYWRVVNCFQVKYSLRKTGEQRHVFIDWLISPFSVSGAHGHWVGSTDTPSHSTKELEMR